MHTARTLLALAFVAALAAPVTGQEKRPLDHDDYARWNRIQNDVLSDDGRWLAYRLVPGEGDATLTIRDLRGDAEFELERGAQPRFTADARYLVAMIEPMEAVEDSLRAAGTRGDDMPDDSLAIVDLSDFSVTRVADVLSYRLPEDAGGWMAYRLTAGDENGEESEEESPEEEEEDDAEAPRLDDGSTLVVRTLGSGAERPF